MRQTGQSILIVALLVVVAAIVVLSLIGIGQCIAVGDVTITVLSPTDKEEIAATNNEALLLPLSVSSNADYMTGEIELNGSPLWSGTLSSYQTIPLMDYRQLFPVIAQNGFVDLILKVTGTRKASMCEATTWFRAEAPSVTKTVEVPFTFTARAPQIKSVSPLPAPATDQPFFPQLALTIGTASKKINVKVRATSKPDGVTDEKTVQFDTDRQKDNIIKVTLPVSMTTSAKTITYDVIIATPAGKSEDKGTIVYGSEGLKIVHGEVPPSVYDPRKSDNGTPVSGNAKAPVTVIPDSEGIKINLLWIIGFAILGVIVVALFGQHAPVVMGIITVGLLIVVVGGVILGAVNGLLSPQKTDAYPTEIAYSATTATLSPSPTRTATITPSPTPTWTATATSTKVADPKGRPEDCDLWTIWTGCLAWKETPTATLATVKPAIVAQSTNKFVAPSPTKTIIPIVVFPTSTPVAPPAQPAPQSNACSGVAQSTDDIYVKVNGVFRITSQTVRTFGQLSGTFALSGGETGATDAGPGFFCRTSYRGAVETYVKR